MTPTVVVTGANRGIGLALCNAWRGAGAKVIATCRASSSELDALEVEIIPGIDLLDPASSARLREGFKDRHIDILVCNAGVLTVESLDDLDFDRMEEQWQVNVLGTLRVIDALLDRLGKGSKIALLSSRMGSMADNTSGGYYGYRMSKAALNAAGKSLAVDLKPRGIAVGIYHPGYVKTRMTRFLGELDPDLVAKNLVKRIGELNLDNSGQFIHSDGQQLPW